MTKNTKLFCKMIEIVKKILQISFSVSGKLFNKDDKYHYAYDHKHNILLKK